MLTRNGHNVNGSFAREHALIVGVVGGSDSQRMEIRQALSKIPEVPAQTIDISKIPTRDEFTMPEVVMAILGEDPDFWESEIHLWPEDGVKPLVVALLSNYSVATMRAALRAGATEVLSFPPEPGELLRCLVKCLEKRREANPDRRCVCYSVASAAGGVGVSSLAVALTFALRRITQRKVVLVDLGLQCSAAAALLDLEPTNTISELVDPTSTIDSIRLESILCAHESGIHLLAAPKRIEEGEMVTASTVAGTLAVLQEMFDFIVIDCGHNINEGSVAAWEVSDKLIYVINQTVTSVRPAQRFMELFERLHLETTSLMLALNRFSPHSVVSIDKIETVLGRKIDLTIPSDDAAFSRAEIEAGDITALAPASAAAHAIEKLTREITGMQPDNNSHGRRFFGRLLSAVGF